MCTLQLLLYLVMYLLIIFSAKYVDNNFQQNDNISQIWLIISTLPTTMLKNFRSCVSADVDAVPVG